MEHKPAKLFPLGKNGPLIPRIGLGCMGMSAYYGCRPSEEESLNVGIEFYDFLILNLLLVVK